VMPSGPTEYRGGRGRGIFAGGVNPGLINAIDYITIATTGNASDFGDLISANRGCSAASNSTRGVICNALNSNRIEYITISSTGNAFDFGDLLKETFYPGCAADNTRALFAGGYDQPNTFYRTIEYITISTLGNSSEFGLLQTVEGSGDKNKSGRTNLAAFSSPTRAIFAGGNGGFNYPSTAPSTNIIDYVTIQSLGNGQDFGDLTLDRSGVGGCSSSVRGVFGGGHTGTTFSPLNVTNILDYITIASLGNAQDFGDLTQARERVHSCSNSIRGVWGGGRSESSPDTPLNTIDYITITSTGNAADFGDLTQTRYESGSCSDAHGGLGD